MDAQTKLKSFQQLESLHTWNCEKNRNPIHSATLNSKTEVTLAEKSGRHLTEVHKSTKVCFDRRHPLFALSYV